ncbi:MAG: hypothetical protein ACKVHR_17400 [Pirellulales bacterium]
MTQRGNGVEDVWADRNGTTLGPNLYGMGIQSESNRVNDSVIAGNIA